MVVKHARYQRSALATGHLAHAERIDGISACSAGLP